MKAGDTFLIQNKSINQHLWIVQSDPDVDPSGVVIVNVTTAYPSKERFCLIQAGEHPFVVHETCISYQHAMVTSLDVLVRRRDEGHIGPRPPVSPALLARLRRGVPLSKLIPLRVAAIIARQCLF